MAIIHLLLHVGGAKTANSTSTSNTTSELKFQCNKYV